LPQVKSVVPREQTRLAIGAIFIAVVAVVFWMEGRSLAASFRTWPQQQSSGELSRRRTGEWPAELSSLAPRNPHYQAVAGDLAWPWNDSMKQSSITGGD